MNNRETYDRIFKESFGLEQDKLNEDLVYNGIPTWDSVGHMRLIADLEENFDIMMETDDIIDFSSYLKGMEILKKYEVEI